MSESVINLKALDDEALERLAKFRRRLMVKATEAYAEIMAEVEARKAAQVTR